MRSIIRKHKYKIAVITPIILIATVALNIQDSSRLESYPQGSTVIEQGGSFSMDVIVDAKEPINVVSSLITFPRNLVEVTSVETEGSVIDLWIKEPSFTNNLSILSFGGGTTREGGWTGEGKILTATFKALQPGKAPIEFHGTTILAHDGFGTAVEHRAIDLTYYVIEPGHPSPDINGDGRVGMSDLRIMITQILRRYNERFDLNQDGSVDFKDVEILRSFM